jgi:hypothetical protein
MISAWLKVPMTLAVEVAAVGMLLRLPEHEGLLAYVAINAVASALAGWMAWTMLPEKFREPRVPVFTMLFSFAFFIPVLGCAGHGAGGAGRAALTPRYCAPSALWPWHMPEFSGVQRESRERSDLRAADARRILKDPSLPLETRLRVLVALQSMRPKAAVPLLQGLLADPSEDIRLLAYSMVDAWEKDVTRQIQQARLRLAEARQGDERDPLVNALRRLAELHWMQADTGLARGDLRRFALEQAQKLCEDVLVLDAYVPSIWQLYARVLIELGQLDPAERALTLARKVRMPEQEIWPLMAQIAFMKNDLAGVRKHMARLSDAAQLPHQLRGLASFWRERRVSQVDLHV